MKPTEKQHLFWDTDIDKLDEEKDASFVILRVLNRGRKEDIKWIKQRYGEDKIKEVLRSNLFRLDKKSANLWCEHFNVNANQCIQSRLETIQKKF